jgi:uncharacterized protein (TIRG00374 family)
MGFGVACVVLSEENSVFGKKSNILGIALSAICLFLVFRKVDFHALMASLASLDYTFLAFAILLFLTTFFVRTLRWRSLLAPTKLIAFKRLFAVMFIGYMANNVLPARLGEFVRAYVLSRKENIRKTTTLATIFIERIFDGLSLLFILGLLIAAHRLHWISNALPREIMTGGLLASVLFVGAFGFVAALEFWPAFPGLLSSLIHRLAPATLAPKLESVLGAFVDGVSCLRSLKRLLFVFGASVVVWLIEGSTYALLGHAFHMHLPLTAFLVTMVLVNLASIIPSAPGFIGTFQLFCVIGLGLFAVSKEAALSFGLVLNMGEYIPVTLLGIAFLALENLSFSAVLHPEAENAGETPLRPDNNVKPLQSGL